MNDKRQITVSAPGKLILLGEHAVVYGHPCIVTAVNQRLYLTAELTDKPYFELQAPDVGIKNYKKPISKLPSPRHPELKARSPALPDEDRMALYISGSIPKGAKFVELAASHIIARSEATWQSKKVGLKISTHSDFPSQYGFGSSSAATVCTIFALSKLLNIKLTNKQLFDLSYRTVLDIQGKGSGFDVAAAIYGGTIYFVTPSLSSPQKRGSRNWIPSRPAAKREPHAIAPSTRGGTVYQVGNDIGKDLPLTVAYSGIKAETTVLIAKVADLDQKYPYIVKKTYDLIQILTKNAKNAIKNGDFQTLGELMNINQGYLESLGVSTRKLSAMIYAARETGAYGAKLSGAGGGDCMIALAPPSKKSAIEKAIGRVGGKIIRVQTNAQGVRIDTYPDER